MRSLNLSTPFADRIGGTAARLLASVSIALAFMASTVSADQAPGAGPVVTYSRGLLSVRAAGAPLGRVLDRIADQAGLRIVSNGPLDDPVHADFQQLPLGTGLRRLLGGRSHGMVHQASGDGQGPPSIAVVWVLVDSAAYPSASADPISPEASPASVAEPPPEPQGPAPRDAAPPQVAGAALSAPVVLPASPRPDVAEGSTEAYWAEILEKDLSHHTRQRAVQELGRLDTEAAVAAISIALGDRYTAVRGEAVSALGRNGGPHAVQLLGQVVYGDSAPALRRQALNALATLSDPVSHLFLRDAARKLGLVPQSDGGKPPPAE
jgi:hypothetical protein